MVEGHEVKLAVAMVQVHLLDLCVDIQVRQIFTVISKQQQEEDSSRPQHISFSFPINNIKAGVYRFSASVAGSKTITGLKWWKRISQEDQVRPPLQDANRVRGIGLLWTLDVVLCLSPQMV